MKTNILFNCVILLLINLTFNACSPNKLPTNDWVRMNLKGKVKQIDESYYNSYQSFQKKYPPKKNFTRFGEDGLIIKNGRFIIGDQIHWMRYNYLGDSVYIREVRALPDNTEHPQAYWIYELDERGGQIGITSILLDSSINFHIDMTLNAKGDATDIVYTQKKHPAYVPCRIQKIYNDKGQLAEELTFRFNKITQSCSEKAIRSVFTLDENGNITREILYNTAGNKESTHVYKYEYDEQNNWVRKIHFLGDEAIDVTVRAYTYF